MIVYGAWQSATDLVICTQCHEEFVTECGTPCPECFPA